MLVREKKREKKGIEITRKKRTDEQTVKKKGKNESKI